MGHVLRNYPPGLGLQSPSLAQFGSWQVLSHDGPSLKATDKESVATVGQQRPWEPPVGEESQETKNSIPFRSYRENPLCATFKDFPLSGGLYSHACEQCIRPLMDKFPWSPNLVRDSGCTNTPLRIRFF